LHHCPVEFDTDLVPGRQHQLAVLEGRQVDNFAGMDTGSVTPEGDGPGTAEVLSIASSMAPS
jgi:hypothetical protein